MKLLELFCGTKSVSKAIGHHYDEIINLDILESAAATITIDILEWDYRVYPPGYFHSIWASPPCTEYSKLNYTLPDKVCNVELADRIVKKTLDIIDYFRPVKWFMENPESGTLKNREVVASLMYRDFDYCSFSDWGYRKRTRIWTNQEGESIMCGGPDMCSNMEKRKHKIAIGKYSYGQQNTTLEQRHAIPSDLIKYLFELDEE